MCTEASENEDRGTHDGREIENIKWEPEHGANPDTSQESTYPLELPKKAFACSELVQCPQWRLGRLNGGYCAVISATSNVWGLCSALEQEQGLLGCEDIYWMDAAGTPLISTSHTWSLRKYLLVQLVGTNGRTESETRLRQICPAGNQHRQRRSDVLNDSPWH